MTIHVEGRPKPMEAAPRRKIVLYDERKLTSTSTLQMLASEVKELAISRRSLPDWIADTFYQFQESAGEIVHPNGKPFDLDDEAIDRAFGFDGSFRWVSDFMNVASRPWRQAPQKRVVQRINLIAASLMIDGRIPDLQAVQERERKERERGGIVGRYVPLPPEVQVEREAQARRELETFLDIVDGKFTAIFWPRVTERLKNLREKK